MDQVLGISARVQLLMIHHPLHDTLEHRASHSAAAGRKSQLVQAHDDAILGMVGGEIAAETELVLIHIVVAFAVHDIHLRYSRLAGNTGLLCFGFLPQTVFYNTPQHTLHLRNVLLAGNLLVDDVHASFVERRPGTAFFSSIFLLSLLLVVILLGYSFRAAKVITSSGIAKIFSPPLYELPPWLYEMNIFPFLSPKYLLTQKKVVSLQRILNPMEGMTIVSTRDFRANQTKYLEMVDRGEHVVLRSRRGSYRLTPMPADSEKSYNRDITAEICQGLKDFRDYLDGDKSKMLTWEEMMDELRD